MRIFAVILALVFVSLLMFLLREQKNAEAPGGIAFSMNPEAAAEKEGRYYNERYGFSFVMPEGALAHERKEGSATASIRIEEKEGGEGFQIFVTPYEEATISDERFAMDIPSGIRKDQENITLNGVPAVAFRSEDIRLGSTREIWFLREGYLYEITAVTAHEAWLHDILISWKFHQL